MGDILVPFPCAAVMRRKGLDGVRTGGQNIGVANVRKDRRTNLQGDKKSWEYLSGSRHWLNQDMHLSKEFQGESENAIDSQTPKSYIPISAP
ncbi:MAG: hypothetical protein AUI33_10275 [Ignavibacteria bacterium 13_1_40CM_2_61_4]|nr:MAG: hypothetical protein AUI33_10275 [Ignavibacteria bacterium 13_1_40CM_2_61_4]